MYMAYNIGGKVQLTQNFISNFFEKFWNKKVFFCAKSINKCTKNYLSKATFASIFF